MTTRLALDEPHILRSDTIGEACFEIIARHADPERRHVADALGLPVGRLLMIVKSAHVYETELTYIKGVLG